MKRFKKPLVGVGLSWGDCFVSDKLSEPNAEAVRPALWLARLNSASIDFLFALDLSAIAQELIAESSTGIKLMRKCPCAVWVTQPLAAQELDSILVPHDLRPVGDQAMDLGCSMAKLQNAQLHVLLAAEYPEFDYMFPARVSSERKRTYRNEVVRHIDTQITGVDLRLPAKVHFVIEPPDLTIMNCIEQHAIDLLVMGTVGSTGISGYITGNTVEHLLPRIPCSLLAVKPPGFKSPVVLERSGR
ncbi:Universal stress protein E [Symmachiella dynata]|uniref:Universal stress protein E n=1 Tax=Symmachiella dynata TaxID=2527995 RepID=A0A517ZQ59_9PLAN|nr:universal stress protein [Symmachiella dynata]QDU44626.1 Universal stress protein E [Symmachiella dynata]